jgi:hypothetical protein
MHEYTPRARASLTRGADGAEHDRRHSEVEIRELIDDDAVIATKLEQALAEARGDTLADLATDRGRTRERHEIHATILDQLFREIVARDQKMPG